MKTIAIIMLSASLMLFSSGSFAEDLTRAKTKDIKKLMQLTGAANIGKRISDAMIMQLTRTLKAKIPNISNKALQIMQATVRDVVKQSMGEKDGFMDQVIALYHKHFSHKDIKGLIKFNESPLGKKAIKVMPSLKRESIQTERKWNRTVVPIIEKRLTTALKKEGVDLDKLKKKKNNKK